MKILLKLMFLSLFFGKLAWAAQPAQDLKPVVKVGNFTEKKVASEFDQSLKMMKDSFAMGKMMFDAYKAYKVKDDLKFAEEEFEKIASQYKDPKLQELQAKAIFKLGEIYLLKDDLEKAKINFRLVAALEKADIVLKSEANYNLGAIYLKEKSSKTFYYFSLALNQNEKLKAKMREEFDEAYHFGLGKYYLLKNEFEQAASHLHLAAIQNKNKYIKIKSSILLAKMYINHNVIKFGWAKKYILDAYGCAESSYQHKIKIKDDGDRKKLIDLLNCIIQHRKDLGKIIKEQIKKRIEVT